MLHRRVSIIFTIICAGLCSAKQNFDVILERVEVTEVNAKILHVVEGVRKYNRTCKAYSSNFTLFKDLDYGVTVEIQLYALFSNQYRRTPVSLNRSICDVFKNELRWVRKQVINVSNFPAHCPIRAGDYYLKDFVPNGADFPAAANFPWKSVMTRLRIFYDRAILVIIKMFLTFDHDAELKRLG